MSQTTFSIRMDENVKKEFDAVCEELGLSATVAFNIFARKMIREKKIPFDVAIEPDTKPNATEALLESILVSLQGRNHEG